MTLKNDVVFDISKEDYENAGLEVTYVDGISITGYNVEGGLDVVIPSMINDKKVIEIGDYAFTDNKLTEITIPSSVTIIGDYAFSSNLLAEINFPTTSLLVSCEAFSGNSWYGAYPDNVTRESCSV